MEKRREFYLVVSISSKILARKEEYKCLRRVMMSRRMMVMYNNFI